MSSPFRVVGFFFGGEVSVLALGVRVSYHVPMMLLMLLLLLMMMMMMMMLLMMVMMMMMMMMMMINVADPRCDSGQTMAWNRNPT